MSLIWDFWEVLLGPCVVGIAGVVHFDARYLVWDCWVDDDHAVMPLGPSL